MKEYRKRELDRVDSYLKSAGYVAGEDAGETFGNPRASLNRASYPCGPDMQGIGEKPKFDEADLYCTRSSWDDPTPPTK
ncbi:MAG: hypothetical protein KGL39_04475 [Patescibacteria group bacterium]|nr:hypothetical protein [Patescibacteria group bacterium]